MEKTNMGYAWLSTWSFVLKIHKNSILKILCLQKSFSVDWAIKKSLKAQIPHKIFHILSWKEIFIEILCEVQHDCLKFFNSIQRVIIRFLSIKFRDRTMKETEKFMKWINQFMKQSGIFFLKLRCLIALTLCDCLSLLLRCQFWTIQIFWMLQDNIKPDVGLNLFN